MSEPRAALPLGVLPLVRPVGRFRRWLPAVLYALALIHLTRHPRQSANVISRYMTVEAIAEGGTLALDRTPMMHIARPVDMVRFGGRFYSDKPPVLAALASPVYAALMSLGARFTGSERQFVVDNLAITWIMVGIPSALTLVWTRRLLQAVPIAPWVSDLLTLSLGLCSQMFAYAVTFNNHSVAAALLTGAMASTLLEPSGHRASRSRFLAGFMTALASTIDLPAGGIFLVGLVLLHALRVRSIPWGFVAGAFGPILLHCWLQSLVTGTPLPAEMYPAGFDYPGSYWMRPEGTWHEHGPRWKFGVELLVGPRGWLTVTPALTFGLIGLGLVLARRGDPLRPMARVITLAVFTLLAYYTWGVRRTDFGGDSFGTRHLLAITPPCYFFGAVALERLRSKMVPLLFLIAIVVGGVYARVGMRDPWRPIEEVRKTDPLLQRVGWLVIYPRSQNLEKAEVPR